MLILITTLLVINIAVGVWCGNELYKMVKRQGTRDKFIELTTTK